MQALAYHEAVPRHHFQISLERESPDFEYFQSLFYFTAYTEGWALYSEKIAEKYNLYSDIYSLISYHQSELLSAVRLVLDTGIHFKKWSFEEAAEYMLEISDGFLKWN